MTENSVFPDSLKQTDINQYTKVIREMKRKTTGM